jgi:hypothetical protein
VNGHADTPPPDVRTRRAARSIDGERLDSHEPLGAAADLSGQPVDVIGLGLHAVPAGFTGLVQRWVAYDLP